MRLATPLPFGGIVVHVSLYTPLCCVTSRSRFAIAGANVLLAYLISEGMESWFRILHLSNWYDCLAEPTLTHAVARSVTCAALILALSALLNRVGFRLKL